MLKDLLVGVDLGTTATKAALYRLDGTLVSEARVEVPLTRPAPGHVEQDTGDFYRSAAVAVRRCLATCNADSGLIAGIAFDSQMAGVGAVDEQFQPVMPFDSWLDMRCRPYIDQLQRTAAARITELTGCAPTCDHGPKMMWWNYERPEIARRVAKWIMPAAYVAGRMAGIRVADAFMDYTFLHFTALADARSGAWSDELCGLLGIRKEQLPSIVEPWRQVGEVGDQAAADFGLPVGLPIAAGAGDTAAGALGAGAVTPGILLDTAGTAAVLAACTSRFCADVGHGALIVMRSVVEGVWNPLAYIAGGGLLIPWFRETFLSGDSGEPDEVIFDRIFEQALSAPAGCEGLVFSPHLGGRICPAGPGMRGSWVGFSWSHQRPHFIRAMAESVGYEYVRYLRILKELFPEVSFTEARVIGGCARSTAWNRIKASILGVHYRRVRAPESATWGCALIAAKATGLIGDLATAATEFAPVCAEVIDPDTNDRAAYQRGLETYLRWQHLFERGYEAHR